MTTAQLETPAHRCRNNCNYSSPTPGTQITSEVTGNTYTFREQIGEGFFIVVYSCSDVWNNELAGKVLKPLLP